MKQTIQDLIGKANRKEKLTLWDKTRLFGYCINFERFSGIIWLGFAFLFAKITMLGSVVGSNYLIRVGSLMFCLFLVIGAFFLCIDYGRLKK